MNASINLLFLLCKITFILNIVNIKRNTYYSMIFHINIFMWCTFNVYLLNLYTRLIQCPYILVVSESNPTRLCMFVKNLRAPFPYLVGDL